MKKIYVVCEDYTGAFEGVYTNLKDAKKSKEAIGGYIPTYELDKNNNFIEKD